MIVHFVQHCGIIQFHHTAIRCQESRLTGEVPTERHRMEVRCPIILEQIHVNKGEKEAAELVNWLGFGGIAASHISSEKIRSPLIDAFWVDGVKGVFCSASQGVPKTVPCGENRMKGGGK